MLMVTPGGSGIADDSQQGQMAGLDHIGVQTDAAARVTRKLEPCAADGSIQHLVRPAQSIGEQHAKTAHKNI